MQKKILTTPIHENDLADIKAGDVIYLTGYITTCRDVAHRRVVEEKIKLPTDVRDGAILHAGPIVRLNENNQYEMVSVGPTTSMRMEKFEKDFVAETGVRLIVGKGGMKENTEAACREYKAIHCVYPAGCAAIAGTQVEEITDVQWTDLGMPESLWTCKVKEYGPLIVSIDINGNNYFENCKVEYNRIKEDEIENICHQVHFIK